MSEGIKLVRNRVIDYAFAYINATYTSGANCYCYLNGKRLEAENTSGYWVFKIPYAGEWTVEIEKDGVYNSKVVSISTFGEVVNVTLALPTVLLNGDNQYIDITGGWSGYTSIGDGGIVLTGVSTYGKYTNASTANNILIPAGSTLKALVTNSTVNAWGSGAGRINNSIAIGTASKTVPILANAEQTVELPIETDITAKVELKTAAGYYDAVWMVGSMTVERVWFE